jgi:hypothetical protein
MECRNHMIFTRLELNFRIARYSTKTLMRQNMLFRTVP